MLLQLIGWGPDLDPSTPGVMVDCSNIIPRDDGFGVVSSPSNMVTLGSVGYPRSFISSRAGESALHTVFASYASDSTLSTLTYYEVDLTGSVTARQSCTAGTYAVPVIFRQFDAKTVSARADQPMRFGSAGADFTAISGAPSCSLLETTKDFVIAFNTSDGYDWYCSSFGDMMNWTLSVSNQCVRGEFFDKDSKVVAARRFGEMVVAWTEAQTWLGRYVGAPEVWQWEQISRSVGCVGPEAAIDTPYGVVWLSKNDVHIYDGTSIRPLDTKPVRRTLIGLSPSSLLKYTQLAWDAKRDALWVFMPLSVDTRLGVRDNATIYHFGSKKWGRGTVSGMRAANQGQQYAYSFDALANTYDDMLFVTGSPAGSDQYLKRLAGSPNQGTGYMVLGYVGDPNTTTMLRSVKPIYSERGSVTATASVQTRYKSLAGGDFTAGFTTNIDADYKFPMRQTGRWHAATIYLNGTDIISAVDLDLKAMGAR